MPTCKPQFLVPQRSEGWSTIRRRWRSDVNSFPGLDGQASSGPSYVYEYNTRETYGKDISGWGPNDPLNATWWHLVTEREISSVPPWLVPLFWHSSRLCFQRWKQIRVLWRYRRSEYFFFANLLTLTVCSNRYSMNCRENSLSSRRTVLVNALPQRSVICAVALQVLRCRIAQRAMGRCSNRRCFLFSRDIAGLLPWTFEGANGFWY